MRVSEAPRGGQPEWNAFRARVLLALESIVSDHACGKVHGYGMRAWAYELAERLPLEVESDSDQRYLEYLVHGLTPLATANFKSTIGLHGQLKLL